MSSLAVWLTNTGTDPFDVLSLVGKIGGSATRSLYPDLPQLCPQRDLAPQDQCLLMLSPSISPTKGNPYTVTITLPDGATTISFTATYGDRSDNPDQFTIQELGWSYSCCKYALNIQITNTGAADLDTDQMVASMTLNGNSFPHHESCERIASGSTCHLMIDVDTFASYVIVLTDPRNAQQIYLITPG